MNIWFIRVWFVVNEKIRKKLEHLHYNIFSACIVMKTKSIPNLKFKDICSGGVGTLNASFPKSLNFRFGIDFVFITIHAENIL